MKLEACLILMLNAISSGMRRGPHHPHGQIPVDHKHHHYQPRGSESLTADSDLLHDTKHLEEDSQVLSEEMLSKMTPEEMEFHYFSVHDFDRNSMLDGLELLKAVYHTMEHEVLDADEDSSIEPIANSIEMYVSLVDRTLKSDDTNNDGYVSYAEYRAARARKDKRRAARQSAASANAPA
ncbi:multiple coagulation factor deficiency protein 2 homolog [Trichoplusia ni]|uniref:Multiple coagulation factor deficiency protein 2 homolog n=1 Tax=Trichoplusia ni TaxID=7111 RepID=A0A7E5VS05_TRINI|nr:multiple coagulation factor deficiency protein 2 homolog [Trichoplusia ni]